MRWIGVREIGLLVILLSGGQTLAQDRYFVSTYDVAPDSAVYEIDFVAGTATQVLTGLDQAEDIVCKEETRELFICESLASRLVSYDLVTGTLTNIIPAAGLVEGPEGPSLSPTGDLYFNTRGPDPDTPIVATGVWSVAGGDPANPAVNVVPTFAAFGEGSVFGTAGASAGGLLAVDSRLFGGRVILSNPPGSAPVDFIPDLPLPIGIAVNSSGEVFVAHYGFGNISKWSPDGVPVGDLITGLWRPLYLEFDSFDNAVIAEYTAFRAIQVDPSGTVIAQVLLSERPVGVAICRAGLQPPQGPGCDIKSGSDPNSVNPRSQGVIPVAILGSSGFDASEIDPATVSFGPHGAAPAHEEMIHHEDVNADGMIDAVFHFRTPETGIVHGDTEACISWMTFAGDAFTCCDEIRTVPPHGRRALATGCSGVIGVPMPPADILGTMLPLLALALGLLALRLLRDRREMALAYRRAFWSRS